MTVFHRGFNTVDRVNKNMIVYDLDHPDASDAVDLESKGYKGDSGSGAIYEEADGTLRIIGVLSNGYPVYYGSQG